MEEDIRKIMEEEFRELFEEWKNVERGKAEEQEKAEPEETERVKTEREKEGQEREQLAKALPEGKAEPEKVNGHHKQNG
jgi:hypothetical protein